MLQYQQERSEVQKCHKLDIGIQRKIRKLIRKLTCEMNIPGSPVVPNGVHE